MPFLYSVKFVCGVQKQQQQEECTPVRPGSYSTEINIHNFSKDKRASIEKSVLLLVRDNKPVGREPEFAKTEPFDRIVLPPRTATMDDCCLLGEKLRFAAGSINIGFLEILSNIDVNVSVVYTAADPKGASIGIDVETVAARRV